MCYGCSIAIYNSKKEKQNPSIIDCLGKKIWYGFELLPHKIGKASVSGLHFILLVMGYDLGLERGNVVIVFITEHDQNYHRF